MFGFRCDVSEVPGDLQPGTRVWNPVGTVLKPHPPVSRLLPPLWLSPQSKPPG